jgi:hypothetical protein
MNTSNYKSIISPKEAHFLTKEGKTFQWSNCKRCDCIIAATEIEKYCSEVCKVEHELLLIREEQIKNWLETNNYAATGDFVNYNEKAMKIAITNITCYLEKADYKGLYYILIEREGVGFLKATDLKQPFCRIQPNINEF